VKEIRPGIAHAPVRTGKLVVRRGRKATGLVAELAGLPRWDTRHFADDRGTPSSEMECREVVLSRKGRA